MVLGAALPVAVVWVSAMLTGQASYVLTALAILVPIAHVLRYPNVWAGTMVVSLVLSILLAIVPALAWDLSALGLLWRLTWLAFLFVALFLLLVAPIMMLTSVGPQRLMTASATRCSHLDPETLGKAITLAPGHQTSRITCGEADDDGRFPVSVIVAEMQTCAYEIGQCDSAEAADELLRELGHDVDGEVGEAEEGETEALIDADGMLRHEYYAVVRSTEADHHEVFTFESTDEAGGFEIVAVRHEFQPLASGGTRVTITESGGKLAYGDAFGFWLAGFLDDHLTDEIDHAEGRTPRSNRSGLSRQFVVELANLILPLLGGRRIPPPAEYPVMRHGIKFGLTSSELPFCRVDPGLREGYVTMRANTQEAKTRWALPQMPILRARTTRSRRAR